MMYKNWNSSTVNVVAIPRCSNETSFNSMNRDKNPFIDNLPHYITGSDAEIEVEEAIGWILKIISFKYDDIFLKRLKIMGFPITTRCMDDDTAQAMWDETNLNLKGQRIMLRYIRVIFENIIMIPSSSTIT